MRKIKPMSTADEIEIRPLENDQHADWYPLWRGYQAFYKVDIPADVSEVTWTRLLDSNEPMAGALAWKGTRAVGLVHYIRHRSCWTVGDYCYLQDLFVDGTIRGAGIGRGLIQHVYAEAERLGCSRVYWLTHETNTSAMKLYEQVGDRSGFVQYRHLLG